MSLDVRHEPTTIPTYSLTGDLLSYLRCGLQYRYQNGSALPPARPVQLWFGEFIHGVLEMAYLVWKERQIPLPWPSSTIEWSERETGKGLPEHDIGEIGRRVERVLAIQGKIPRNRDARMAAYKRATAAINLIGPDLFPLVVFAEEPLAGSRALPAELAAVRLLRAERYGVTGVADVLTHMSLNRVPAKNLIRSVIESALAGRGSTLPPEFEVIVDYKGAGRPDHDHDAPIDHQRPDYWQQHDWQIQMYAWLRGRKPEAKPVVAGIVIYINELLPNVTDLQSLRKQMRNDKTDVLPQRGSPDYYVLSTVREDTAAAEELTSEFRIKRALRVIPVDPVSIERAGHAFDRVVVDIESRIAQEIAVGDVTRAWPPNCTDESTCVACDSRYFCPKPAGVDGTYMIGVPPVP